MSLLHGELNFDYQDIFLAIIFLNLTFPVKQHKKR